MRRALERLLGALGVFAVSATSVTAELDDLAFELHRDQEPQVRWDNIEGGPYLRYGDAPHFDVASGNHVVSLAPGETATLWLPGGADLLLQDRWEDGAATPNGFEKLRVATSRDGAAWLRVKTDRRGQERRTLAAPHDTPYLVRLTAPEVAGVRLATFRARRVDVPEQPLYRYDVTPAASRTLAIGDRRRAVRELGRNGRVQVEVDGPTRLAVAHRRLGTGPRLAVDAPYSLTVEIDGRRARVVPGRSRAQRAAVARLDGTPVAVSTAERAYVRVPPGEHTVTVGTSVPVLLRLLQRRRPDYLLARPAAWADEPDDRDEPDVQDPTAKAATELSTPRLERVLRAWLRTPSGSGQGVAAAAKLAERAETAPFPGDVRQAAADIRGGHTFGRDLMPDGRVSDAATAYVYPGRLRDPSDLGDDPPVMLRREATDLAAGLGTNAFVRLGAPGPGTLSYPLPERTAPSELRLAVARGGLDEPVILELRLADGRWRRVRVTPEAAGPGMTAPSVTLASLRLFDGGNGSRSHPIRGTLGGRYTALGESAPLIAVGVVEVPLPADVERIQVRHVRGPAARVGLAYAAGKPYRLDERGYRHAVRQIGGDAAARARFAAQLQARLTDQAAPAASSPFAAALDAHWQPLVDLLAARRATYASGIHDRGHRFDAPDRARPSRRVESLRARARRLVDAEAWGAAAQAWGRLAGMTTGAAWRRAEMARIGALLHAGSEGLAQRLLRGFHLYSDDPAMRTRAFARLRERFRAEERTDLLLGAYTVQYQHTGRLTDLAPAVALLLDSGDDRRALDLAAVVPDDAVAAAQRVRAYRAGEWNTAYERARGELPDPAASRWRALDALAAGDPGTARRMLARHAANRPWLQALDRGLAIDKALAGPADAATLERWHAWSRDHPGPRRFESAMRLVTDAAGRPTLRSLRRDTPVDTVLATPDQPVQLTAPAGRLRVTFRLRLASGKRDQQGWAHVRVGDETRHVSVSATGPSAGLAPVAGSYAVGPGRTQALDLEGTRGRITLAVDRAMLIQVERASPVQKLPVLPTPWPGVAAALTAGDSAEHGPCQPKVSVVASPGEERSEVCGRLDGLAARLPSRGPKNDIRLAGEASDVAALRERLARCPAPYAACQAVATEVYARDVLEGGSRDLDRLRDLVAPYVGWERVEQVVASAGIRTVEATGWQPHSPVLRARQPFLGDLPANAQVLTGPGDLYFDFANQSETTLLLDLRTVDMPTYPQSMATVRYRLDDGRWRTTQVGPDGGRVAIDVPAGRHSVAVTLGDPLSERWVVVTARERRGDGVQAVEPALERSYEVATRDDPAVFAVDGPALVRVDRYGETGITSTYRRVATGADAVRIAPPDGRRESLVRVYELRHRGAAPSSQPRFELDRPVEPDGAADLVVDQQEQRPAPIGDRPLHGQEDGTTSLALGYRLRRQADDEPGGSGDRDGFLAVRGEHRFYEPEADRFLFGRLIGRTRTDGRPTLGVESRIQFPDRVIAQAEAWPLDLSVSLSGFVQDTDASGIEGALTGRVAARHRRQVAERTWVTGRVDAFARYVSLDTGLAGDETADSDVFTRYKRDHPIGWGVQLGARHAPFLDTRLYADVGVRSNADLWIGDPDNVYAEAGVRQFLAGARLDLSYRETRYFADGDRREALSTRRISLDVGYDLWRPDGDRLELTADLRHDLRQAETSFGVFLTWHFGGGQRAASRELGNGRLFRDFRPEEETFRSLRESRAPGWGGAR